MYLYICWKIANFFAKISNTVEILISNKYYILLPPSQYLYYFDTNNIYR